MINGKIRKTQHITGDKAVKLVKEFILPPEWVAREMNPDYGIDLDVELFDYEGDNCVTLGEHIFVQVKGTESPQYGRFKINGTKVDVIKYSMETSELNLVERMGSAFPVLLIIVDLIDNNAYQICLNDYISKVLPVQNPKYREQNKVNINIPVSNKVTSDNLEIFRWYGKRVKIVSMFHEMLSDIDDFKYMSPEEIAKNGKQFIDHYRTYDALNCTTWYGITDLRERFEFMSKNDYVLPEAINIIKSIIGPDDNWKDSEVFESFDGMPINSYIYAQKHSLESIFNIIVSLNGMFESYCRNRFMPGQEL